MNCGCLKSMKMLSRRQTRLLKVARQLGANVPKQEKKGWISWMGYGGV